MDKIEKNHFVANLVNDWHSKKIFENESFERFKIIVNHELKDKKIEFCDNEKNLDFKILEDDEKELYLETFDKNRRMACGLIKKQEYTSSPMFMSKLSKHDLLTLKHLLLTQLKEIDMLLNMNEKISIRDSILSRIDRVENDEEDDEIGWLDN